MNTGHGHVYPRPDGVVNRCGGPTICGECARDQARQDAGNRPFVDPGVPPAPPLALSITSPGGIPVVVAGALAEMIAARWPGAFLMPGQNGFSVGIPDAEWRS